MENNNLKSQLRQEVQARFLKLFNWILVVGVLSVGVVFIKEGSLIVPVVFAGGFLLLINAIIYHFKPNYNFFFGCFVLGFLVHVSVCLLFWRHRQTRHNLVNYIAGTELFFFLEKKSELLPYFSF